MSYKAIFDLLFAINWEINQMDIKTIFLYGFLEGKVQVNQLNSFNNKTTKVC